MYSETDGREININENLSEKDVMGILYRAYHYNVVYTQGMWGYQLCW